MHKVQKRLVKNTRDCIVCTKQILALCWRVAPIGTLLILFATILVTILPVLIAEVGKHIVDGVVEAQKSSDAEVRAMLLSEVRRWLLVELGAISLAAFLERALGSIKQRMGLRLGTEVNMMIMKKALKLDLENFENPAYYDKLTRARREASSRPIQLLENVLRVFSSCAALIIYSAILVRLNTLIAFGLLAATVPVFLAEIFFSSKTYQIRNRLVENARRLFYLESVIGNEGYAKEVRILGLGKIVLERYRSLAAIFEGEERVVATKGTVWSFTLSLLSTGAFYAGYFFVAITAVNGLISLGQMTFYVLMFRQAQTAIQSFLGAVSGGYEQTLYMSNLFEFLNLECPTRALSTSNSPPRTEKGIRFENVSYRYLGANRNAVSNVSFFLKRGEMVTLMGGNGAGKTTLIKLLVGLYKPSSGNIYVDGINICDQSEEEFRKRLGVIFQDFCKYHFTVRECVGFGDVEHIDNDVQIHRAIESGNAHKVMEKLPRGLENQLGNYFENGAELSGGEWQRLALARLFMRVSADILVLDEPTAALDIFGETDFIKQLRQLAPERVTILASHRISVANKTDRIVIMENGRVSQQGTHDELALALGSYADMVSVHFDGAGRVP